MERLTRELHASDEENRKHLEQLCLMVCVCVCVYVFLGLCAFLHLCCAWTWEVEVHLWHCLQKEVMEENENVKRSLNEKDSALSSLKVDHQQVRERISEYFVKWIYLILILLNIFFIDVQYFFFCFLAGGRAQANGPLCWSGAFPFLLSLSTQHFSSQILTKSLFN